MCMCTYGDLRATTGVGPLVRGELYLGCQQLKRPQCVYAVWVCAWKCMSSAREHQAGLDNEFNKRAGNQASEMPQLYLNTRKDLRAGYSREWWSKLGTGETKESQGSQLESVRPPSGEIRLCICIVCG